MAVLNNHHKLDPWISYQKVPPHDGTFWYYADILQQGAIDGAEGVADLGSEQAHDCDHDDGDESENDGVLDQTLTFFLGSE